MAAIRMIIGAAGRRRGARRALPRANDIAPGPGAWRPGIQVVAGAGYAGTYTDPLPVVVALLPLTLKGRRAAVPPA
jgi:hypothetical protein